MFQGKRLYLTIHVDDLFVVGDQLLVEKFFRQLEEREGWKLEKKGPFERLFEEEDDGEA